MLDYSREKYRVKNIHKDHCVERCGVRFKPEEEKTVYLTKSELFQVKACVYLSVINQTETKTEDVKINITKEEKPEELKCPKCGKKYKDEKYYNIHMEKCKVGE